jgi:hypothetical protein
LAFGGVDKLKVNYEHFEEGEMKAISSSIALGVLLTALFGWEIRI